MQLAWALLAAESLQGNGYISIGKVIPVLVVLLLWARILTFIDKDSTVAHLPREGLNSAMLGGMVVAFFLFLLLPGFALGLIAFVVIMLVEVGVYLGMRNSKIGLADLKKEIVAAFKGLKKHKEVKVEAGAVGLMNKKGAPMAPPAAETPERLGYDAVQTLLTDPLDKRAERIELTPGEGAATVRYVVDGVAYNAPSMDRNSAAAAITLLKQMAALSLEEKRKPQTGDFKVMLDGKKHDLEINTAGSTVGEFLKVTVDPKKRHSLRLEQLGFTPDQMALIKAEIEARKGIVLLAAPKGHGLTSMLYGILRAHDAFTNHIQSVERAPDQDLEGITQNKLAANATPADEFKQVGWVTSQEPDVLMVSQVDDPRSAKELVRYVKESEKDKQVFVGIRAGSTADAIAAWRKLVGDDEAALKQLRMVIAGRVLRKLCGACKVAYAPDAEQLRKLNITVAADQSLYQARTQPMRDQKGNVVPCEFCKELRYNGRVGVYEVLMVDDDVRAVVLAGGSPNQLKAAFRKQKGKFLQEVALAQVTTGETSVQEVLRVMKSDAPAGPAGGGGAGIPRAGGPHGAAPRPAGGARPAGAPQRPVAGGPPRPAPPRPPAPRPPT